MIKRDNISKRRIHSGSPHRECIVCGEIFKVPDVKRSNGYFTYSRRQTCGSICANILRSNAMEIAHEKAKKDPVKYKKWVGRDYVKMGRLGGLTMHQNQAIRKELIRKK